MAIQNKPIDFESRSGLITRGTRAVTSSTGQTGTVQIDGGAAIAKNLIVGSSASIYGPVFLGDSLVVSTTATFLGSIQLAGIVGADTQVNNLLVNNISTLSGPVIIYNSATVYGPLYLQGTSSTLNVSAGTATFGGNVLINAPILADIDGSGALALTAGGLYVNQNIVVASTLSSLVTTASNSIYTLGGIGISQDLFVRGDTLIHGNLTVLGTQTIINSTSTSISDPVIDIGTAPNNQPLTVDDGLSKGLVIHYYTTADNHMFVGRSASTGRLVIRDLIDPGYSGNIPNEDYINNGFWGGLDVGSLNVYNSTITTNSATGALKVVGGISSENNIYAAGNIYSYNTVTGKAVIGNTVAANNLTQNRLVFSNQAHQLTDTSTLYVSNGDLAGRAWYANTATNLAGGVAYDLVYQAAPGVTNFLPIQGTGGYVLQSDGSQFFWGMLPGSVVTGSAFTATNLLAGFEGAIPYQVRYGQTSFTPDLIYSTATQRLTALRAAFTSTENATNTATGAVVITGGAAVGEDLWVGGTIYSQGSPVLTGAAGQYVSTIIAGTDTAVSTSTGNITIWNTSTLQSITDRGNSTTNAVVILNAAAATSTDSGALQVTGGVGVGGDVIAQGGKFGNIQVGITNDNTIDNQNGNITITASGGTVTVNNDLSVTGTVNAVGTATFQKPVDITDSRNSISTVSGALTVLGGVGIGRDLHVGGTIVGDLSGTANSANNLTGGTTGQLVFQSASGVTAFTGPGTEGDILVSRGTSSSGPTFQNTLTLSGTTESISSTTGALQVAGGVGIGRDLWVGGQAYIDGAIALTSATVNLYASKTILTAGTDTAISTSTGEITIWNISTLQSVTDRGASTTNAISILNTLTVADTIFAGTGLYNNGAGIDLLSYDPNVHYVSDSNGSDTNNGHWLAAPYKTIKHALNQAAPGDKVYIQPGTYTEEFPITIPQGVSVRGAGLRAVFVQPTTATNTASAFLLNGETSITDFTVGNFYKPGYAFQFAPGAKITTRSPYVERFSVITRGSVTSTADPYGFNSADAGNGAYLDASILDPTSLEPAMLWNEATFIVPNATGMYMTNGARAELLNGFFYFADTAVNAVSGTTGYGGVGKVKLRVTGTNGVFVAGDTITYKDPSGNTLASGTISSTASGGYIYLSSPVWGFDTVVDRTAKIVTAYGGAKLVTADQRFGSASLRITTSTDYAEVLHDGDFAFGSSSSYTIEAWIKPDAVGLGRTQNVIYKGTVASSGIRVGVSTNNKATVQHGSAVITGTTTLSASAWNHIAMVRDAGANSLTLYVNGVANGTTAATGSVINTDPVSIGSDGSQGFLGWIDELRISSIVRYPSAFTPSTTGLSSDPATVLMLHFDGGDQSTVITDDAYATQDIYSTGSGPATAARITLADYHQFGAELRCIGSAAVFGNKGVVANGTGTDLKLIAFNLSFVGAGGDLTDDSTLVCQENELIELNDGKIYYQTVDQNGDFRVGNNFLINQRTGEVSFGASAVNLNNVSSINVTNGVDSTFITPGNISVGNLNLSGNNLASLSGNITIAPSGSLTTVDSNLQVNGSVNITQPSFINGSPIVTVGTIGTAGVSKIIAGTDTAITSATGQVTIWNTSTFQSVTDRGSVTTNVVNFLNNSNATTSTNGTVVVSGGQGIGRDLWVGGDIYAPNRIIVNTITATNLIVTGNTYIPGGITATNFTTTELTVVGQTVLQALIAAIATVTNLTVSSLVDLGPMRVYGTFTGSTSTMSNLYITDYTTASNTYTGALIVNGGVGVGGSLYANGLYDEGSRVITQINLPQFGVATIIAGTDTAVSTAAGVVTVWNTSTLQSITARGATTPSPITITNTDANVGSTAANALSVAGGVGIGASLLVGGNAVFGGNVTFNGTTTNVFSTNTIYTDNIIDQHVPSPAPWTVNDGKDIGTRYQIYNTTATSAFLGRINGSGYLEWYGTGVDTSATNNITGVYGTFKTGSIVLADTTSSALTVAGGASFGGTLLAAELFDNNNRVVTTVIPVSGTAIGIDSIVTTGTAATFRVNNLGVTSLTGTTYIGLSQSTGSVEITNLGVQTLTAGTDTAVSASTGTVVVWNTSTLQSVTARGATTPSAITISNDTQSASTNTGALIVTGGAGLGGNLYVGGNFVTDGSSQLQNLSAVSVTATSINVAYFTATVATVTNLTVHNSLYVGGASTLTNLLVTGDGTVNGTFTVTNTTPASSTSTGALTVGGGVGVAGDLWVGGTIYGSLGGSINTATNIADGLAGQVPYQSAPGQTAFTGPGNAGEILVSRGSSGPVFQNTLTLAGNNVSTSTQTGALVVAGGVGVGGNIYFGGNLYQNGVLFTGASTSTTSTFTINNGTVSTSTTTGALVVQGGVGVGGSVYIGNKVGFVNTSNVSVVYQFYNAETNSLDTVFG
jgi:hypothetical protein